MLNRKGLLLVVSGPSGAGKGTICKALLNKNDQIKLSVSATTRKPRNGEVHGVNYFFIEKEEFTKMVENGEFLEHAQIYDNFYGTPKAAIIECLEKGQDIILEIEMQGARQIKEVSNSILKYVIDIQNDTIFNTLIASSPGARKDDNIKRFSKKNSQSVFQK